MQTLTIEPEFASWILESLPNDVNNDGVSLFVQMRADTLFITTRSVMSFEFMNLPELPDVLTSAILTITSPDVSGDDRPLKIRRITEDTLLIEDETTWNEYSGGNAWATPGGDWTTDNEVTYIADFGEEVIDITGLTRDAIEAGETCLQLIIMQDVSTPSTRYEIESLDTVFSPLLSMTFGPARTSRSRVRDGTRSR